MLSENKQNRRENHQIIRSAETIFKLVISHRTPFGYVPHDDIFVCNGHHRL